MTKAKEEKVIAKTPSGFSVVAREFKKDKGAFAALLTLSAILLFVVGFNTVSYTHLAYFCRFVNSFFSGYFSAASRKSYSK